MEGAGRESAFARFEYERSSFAHAAEFDVAQVGTGGGAIAVA
jgi:hypothetical protein